jgi:hypothetical protein
VGAIVLPEGDRLCVGEWDIRIGRFDSPDNPAYESLGGLRKMSESKPSERPTMILSRELIECVKAMTEEEKAEFRKILATEAFEVGPSLLGVPGIVMNDMIRARMTPEQRLASEGASYTSR